VSPRFAWFDAGVVLVAILLVGCVIGLMLTDRRKADFGPGFDDPERPDGLPEDDARHTHL